MTYRVRNIGVAVALAAVAALLTSFYVTNYKRHVQRGESHVTVLVAKRNIPAGTAGSDASGMLTTEQLPRRSVVPGAIANPNELRNLVASSETFAGEQVTTQRFSSEAETGVRAQLRGTLRAFQFQGDQNQLLAGTLKAGDRVDFVDAAQQGGNGDFFSRVMVRDLKVLQAPNAPSSGSKLTSSFNDTFSVMLAMTDSQAQKIQYLLANANNASAGSRWHLELRPVVHDADSADHIDTFVTVLSDGLSPSARRILGGK